ncbi:MAG: hypothetical protein JRS35_03315 [Deltaproteobacteria bacterium]|nr:hypothetical protein [Deltaproteobacteria bacterium]
MRNVAAPRRRAFASVPKGMASVRLLCLLIPLLVFPGMPERATAAEPPAKRTGQAPPASQLAPPRS